MNLKGEFKKYLFHNESNGYSVILFDDETDGLITCTGYLPQLSSEYTYLLTGEYVDHPKYGFQFKIDTIERETVTDKEHLVNYLSGALFVGIGKKMASKIVDTFGDKTIEMIKFDPNCLDEITGMTKKKKQAIVDGLNNDNNETYFYLTSHHLSMKNIVRLEMKYGSKLLENINDNPYKMVYEVDGIGFATADKFALDIGFDLNHPYRLEALVLTTFTTLCIESADSYIEYDKAVSLLNEKTNYQLDIEQIIDSLINRNLLVKEDNRLYLESQFTSEKYIASYLANCPKMTFDKVDNELLLEKLNEIEIEFGIQYQEKQREAILSFFENDIMILTGGPGTGKTTIVRGMVELTRRLFPSYTINLAAPTGRASKRLAQLTNCEAKTIHSLLRWDKDTGIFAKNQDDPLLIDLLIIDEFSMVDNWLFYNLLKACGYVKKIILIGDQDQLPSVGIGSVLRDIIATEKFKVVRLSKIYRQKEGSDIIQLASDIKNDVCDDFNFANDIRFIECSNEQIKDVTVAVSKKAMESYADINDGFYNVQILAPRYKGSNGIDSLNVLLQETFNPKDSNKRELLVGYKTFRVGDKILQLKNYPDDDVYNGDIGVLIDVIFASEDINNQNRLIVDFEGVIVEYTPDMFVDIALAYTISVHKAQGSEYPIVIVPMSNEYGIMLQKRLIYTAITRANKNLIIIGSKQAFFNGIKHNSFYHRKTTLKEKILKELENETLYIS